MLPVASRSPPRFVDALANLFVQPSDDEAVPLTLAERYHPLGCRAMLRDSLGRWRLHPRLGGRTVTQAYAEQAFASLLIKPAALPRHVRFVPTAHCARVVMDTEHIMPHTTHPRERPEWQLLARPSDVTDTYELYERIKDEPVEYVGVNMTLYMRIHVTDADDRVGIAVFHGSDLPRVTDDIGSQVHTTRTRICLAADPGGVQETLRALRVLGSAMSASWLRRFVLLIPRQANVALPPPRLLSAGALIVGRWPQDSSAGEFELPSESMPDPCPFAKALRREGDATWVDGPSGEKVLVKIGDMHGPIDPEHGCAIPRFGRETPAEQMDLTLRLQALNKDDPIVAVVSQSLPSEVQLVGANVWHDTAGVRTVTLRGPHSTLALGAVERMELRIRLAALTRSGQMVDARIGGYVITHLTATLAVRCVSDTDLRDDAEVTADGQLRWLDRTQPVPCICTVTLPANVSPDSVSEARVLWAGGHRTRFTAFSFKGRTLAWTFDYTPNITHPTPSFVSGSLVTTHGTVINLACPRRGQAQVDVLSDAPRPVRAAADHSIATDDDFGMVLG